MLALVLLTQPACTTIIVGEDSTHEILSLGVTRVVVPERKGELIAFKRTGFGLGYGNAIGDAAWLGLDSSEWVIADPGNCQMLVVIRSDAEAESAAKILERLDGEDVCYVKDTAR